MEAKKLNTENSNHEDVRLPESVEVSIERISVEKQTPPLKVYARKMLRDIGEQASLQILDAILSSRSPIKSFSGFVSYFVKKDYPIQAAAVLSAYESPSSASPNITRIQLGNWVSFTRVGIVGIILIHCCWGGGAMGIEPEEDSCLDAPGGTNWALLEVYGFIVQVPVSLLTEVSLCSSVADTEGLQSPLSNVRRTGFQNIRRQLSFEDETLESRSSLVRDVTSLSREHGEMAKSIAISPQLSILSKLEYRKLFLLLSYIKGNKLEAVVAVDDANEVFSMKHLSMPEFENNIWDRYGSKFCKESDCSQYLDWDSGKTHIYYCEVSSNGSCIFKGPYLNRLRTHLQRSLGDDNVLIVKFSVDGEYSAEKIVEQGLLVGLRRFRFFVFKDERKKVKKNRVWEDRNFTYSDVKCYFVHFDSISSHGNEENYILSRKSVSEARCLFMHIHTLSSLEKYMARFSLILSKTTKLHLDFAAIIVEIIEDIPFKDENGSIIHDEDGKPILHTDGTGYISEDLAMKYITDSSSEKHDQFATFGDAVRQERGAAARINEPPLLIQCRLFHDGYAVKGTLLLNRKLEPGRIQIRPSMIKVEKDQALQSGETLNSLEIVNISHRPLRNYLSKYLIALLSYGGVPQEFFLNLLSNALQETRNVYSNRRTALRVASLHDGLYWGFEAQRMICSGVPLNEPYLQHCLYNLEKGEKTKLKEGKLPVNESFYLMGTADPTGVLNNDEVCVILDSGQISGKVLVYRNPGMHFGDIHVMEAVYVKELEDFVGNAKYGIFFSTKGQKSAAYEMATGDFDGDLYWISRNPELLKHFKANDPWRRVYSVPDAEKRNPQTSSNLELELFQLFLEARKPSYSMGIAADSWLAYMDRLLSLGDDRAIEKNSLNQKMVKLIDIYYDALDAPKSGKKVDVPGDLIPEMFPHHMGKKPEMSYRSLSILGKIYDTVLEFHDEAPPRRQELRKLPCFDVSISEEHVTKWKRNYDRYRREMTDALKSSDESKSDAADDVVKKYKKLLYEAPDMEESAKDTQVIYEEALAIYHVTYDYASIYGVEKCGFAWKVAGSALCNLCAWKSAARNEKPVTIMPSVLRSLLN
ncbi:hypothetical protein C2S53_007864 [Perilla frutescens var. hirtella]|uniref:RNA-dependent RNA polymerase n=1 Tax=Perilla frutescens var. hirtella TaxID=608512 RepID=A0AAD4J5G3_PERFH|nr:hypothetical protein C2S53_007864 [Perilla frutescens var. hirtella]